MVTEGWPLSSCLIVPSVPFLHCSSNLVKRQQYSLATESCRLGCAQTATRMDGHAFMTVALTLRSRLSMVVVLCSFSANLTMVLQVSREFFIRSAVFKLAPHDPVGLRVLFRLESQVKKVMTNWELETAVSSHYLNHALRFRHEYVRPANILRTRTVLHFPHFLFLKLTATE